MEEDLDNLIPDDQDTPQFRELRTQRNELAAQNKELNARVRKAEMKAVVSDIPGITLDSRTKFALDHYDGDPDPEAVKSFLSDNGFLEAPAPQVSDEELQVHQEMSDAQTAGTPPGMTEDAHYAELRKLLEAGQNVDSQELTRRATEIMQKYNLPIVIDQGVR